MIVRVIRTIFTDRKHIRKLKPKDIPHDEHIYQILKEKKPISMYFDYDRVTTKTLIKDLRLLQKRYPKKKIYVLGSTKKGHYHIFIPKVVFKNMKELKLQIEQLNLKCDLGVYKKQQLFRLPLKKEPKKDGIYNSFYIFSHGNLKPDVKPKLENYVVNQK